MDDNLRVFHSRSSVDTTAGPEYARPSLGRDMDEVSEVTQANPLAKLAVVRVARPFQAPITQFVG